MDTINDFFYSIHGSDYKTREGPKGPRKTKGARGAAYAAGVKEVTFGFEALYAFVYLCLVTRGGLVEAKLCTVVGPAELKHWGGQPGPLRGGQHQKE